MMPAAALEPGEGGIAVDAAHLFHLRHILRSGPERSVRAIGRAGGFAGKKRGNGLEIVDVRLFSEGDDIRHVDAAATARTAKTHVRTFREERDRATLLIADFRTQMFFGTRRRLRSVAAAGALALAGWRAIETGGRVGLLSAFAGRTEFLPPRARERAMAGIAGALESAHAEAAGMLAAGNDLAEPGLADILDQALARALPGTSLVLASGLDDAGEDFFRLAETAGKRFDLTILLVKDRFETDPPPGAYPYRAIGDGRAGPMRWALLRKSPGVAKRREETPVDARVERLANGRVAVRVLAADCDYEVMAASLVGGVDGR
ncbi:DUF58 domain-containing protein [Aurantimonas sp. VKM B-3413]|uniref:DUF58 domain-containing protein n=1 Tax=Aurantimonas sp. VKM B-3413 TaxID=2779401 RepID=UPI001E3E0DE9|nr:DUF58 domain-containing protein [Aurantimonas sp. VKM B-3413]MCB8836360.1 DUF58 domain-containing protein [Aurantimonas sp. VKM B-3413]